MDKTRFYHFGNEKKSIIKKVIYIIISVFLLFISIKSALSYDENNFTFSYQGRLTDLNNDSLPSDTFVRIIMNDSAGTEYYNEISYIDFFFGDDNTGFDRNINVLQEILYNELYSLCVIVSGESMDCMQFKSPFGLIQGKYIKDGSIQKSDLNQSEVASQLYGVILGNTTLNYDGDISYGAEIGYVAANSICKDEFPLYDNSHFCVEAEIVKSIANGNYNYNGTMWYARGAPGYTANADDCAGWTTNSNIYLGPFWNWDGNGYAGYGRLTNCAQEKPLLCCG